MFWRCIVMFLHLGGDIMVNTRDVIAILDVESVLDSRHSRNFISKQEKEGSIIRITDEETRSFVITEKSEGRRKKKNSVRQIKVYYSPISASTLQKRADLLIRSFSHTSSTNKEQNINI